MYQKELEAAISASKIASKIIMDIYNQDFAIEVKDDNSPVTIADKTADRAIRSYLGPLFPTYAFLTEEGVDDLTRLKNDYVWIVDPLDGTKDFIHRDDEFTVCIALSYKGEIVVGVIAVPVTGNVYYARIGHGAYELLPNGQTNKLQVSDRVKNITVVASRYHRREREVLYLERNKDLFAKTVTLGSTLKAIAIARGDIELFYRGSAGTKEWDVAAADLIVTEAGGIFIKPDGSKIKYNKKDVRNSEGYIIVNKKENIRL
ncbi:MAG: 3'(2'),5'-bisphosphate nucleotidase CysQ [Bacilli bacterium]